ncbi:MAG: hypothetical protein FGM46_09120 [Ferruginibacter sp.]|nr:hypothetical protein [Ferruginibacter sp.]
MHNKFQTQLLFNSAPRLALFLLFTFAFLFSSKAQTVTIGKQVWMSENLNVDKFRNGDPIPEAKTDEGWKKAGQEGKPAWCYYDNDPKNGVKYGKLYNWYALNDPRGLAPQGWHIPSDDEWTILTNFLGGTKVAGDMMKSKMGWNEGGGYRANNGTFYNGGSFGYWWSSSGKDTYYAWSYVLDYSMDYTSGIVFRHSNSKAYGLSVRCLRD